MTTNSSNSMGDGSWGRDAVPIAVPANDQAPSVASFVVRRIAKPWGHELVVAEHEQYAGKLITIEAGCRLSLQYHAQKHETLYILSGRVRLLTGPSAHSLRQRTLVPGDALVIPAGVIHRLEAIRRTTVLEVSTPELDDVRRIEDDYGRAESGPLDVPSS